MIYTFDPLKGPQRTRSTTKKTTNKTSGPSTFGHILQGPQGTGATTTAEALPASSLQIVTHFLASYPDLDERNQTQKVVDWGETMLQHLETLRDGLLMGQYSSAELAQLRHSLDHRYPQDSLPAELEEAFDAIRLRVAVECEKFQRPMAV